MTTSSDQQNPKLLPRSALRPREAAQVLGVSQSKIAKMLANGELRSVKLGWARLIPIDAINEVLGYASKTVRANTEPS